MPAAHPADRDGIRPGTVYVAPPDHHRLIADGFVRVLQGPKEHNTRPAVDPLIRSAAVAHGPRVVGVVLSGSLDDGSAGLAAIHARGGVAVVQDTGDALYGDMPANAARQVPSALRLKAVQIAPELIRLAGEPALSPAETQLVSPELAWEVAVDTWDLDARASPDRPGYLSSFSCPDCGGELWEMDPGGSPRFRCRIGHGYSFLSLLAEKAGAVDDTLNEAFRALKEKEHMERRMATMAERTRNPKGAAYHLGQADRAAAAAAALLRLLLDMRAAGNGPLKERGGAAH